MNNDRRKQLSALIDDLQASGLSDALAKIDDVRSTLEALRDEEQEAFDNLPPGIQDGDRGQLMTDAIDSMETAIGVLQDLIDACDLDDAITAIEEARA